MLLRVRLYLSRKEAQAVSGEGDNGSAATAGPIETPTSAACGAELKENRFRDGTTRPSALLARYGCRKHGRMHCMDRYRAANEALRNTDRTFEGAPYSGKPVLM